MATLDDVLSWTTPVFVLLIAILDINTVLPRFLHPEGTAASIAAGLHIGGVAAYWYGFVHGFVLTDMPKLRVNTALYALAALPPLLAAQAVVLAGLVPLSRKKAGARAVVLALMAVCFSIVLFLVLGLLFVSVPRFPDEAMILFFLQLGFALAVVVYAVEFCMFWPVG